jgi:hypothetical protein
MGVGKKIKKRKKKKKNGGTRLFSPGVGTKIDRGYGTGVSFLAD